MDGSITPTQRPFIERLAVALYAFMKQADLKVEFGKSDGTTYIYNVLDVTGDAQVVAMSWTLDLAVLGSFDLEDSEQGIEKFCAAVTLDLGCQLFKQKVTRLKRFGEETKSSIIIPGR